MKLAVLSAALVSAVFAAGASAQGMMHHDHGAPAKTAAAEQKVPASQKGHEASGAVTKADPAKGKVTIKHGPVESLKWPGMTMAFDVKDAALFDKLKPGAKIDFTFVQSGKSYVVTQVK